jgi:hypothetical protein
MLFFAEEGILRGEAAIGAVTQQQAQAVWDRFEQIGSTSTSDLGSLLQEAEQISEGIKGGKVVEYSPLGDAIRRLSFPIDRSAGAAAECLLHEKTVVVRYNQGDPFRRVLEQVTEPHDVLYPFASVPLVGKQTRQIDALVVDNRFLWKEKTIDPEDIAGLEAFARLLSLSIDNIRLQERLNEEQRVEHWKEVTARIAHTMGTLLFEVHGDVKELSSRLCTLHAGVSKDVEPLLEELNNGISRAEKVLWDLRTFAIPSHCSPS